ncbi:MAG: ABC transporter permease, partial [Anaerolineae bacterium]
MSEGRRERDAAPSRDRARRANWPLRIGSFLVGVVLFLAIVGPMLALNDPREHHVIIQIDGKWFTPPYSAFTPGYPLGSDSFGRDLFSWLLWSVRPTIVLVALVAALRMTLGIILGVGAGWSDRFPGRVCDGLIAAALAVPTLIAALIIITAVGFRVGVWAFVIGLSATGWAETAQLVRERTRTVKGQESVEAARALGASSAQIVILHILPQVMPMIWMLLAFEVSHAVVTTAGLGFLGHYLGGPIFAEVEDFVYRRISEMPELGQMLATVWMVLDEPWAMVAAGSVVFLIVLAFNLVGEGLQVRLTRDLGGSRSLYVWAAGTLVPWVEDHLTQPLVVLFQRRWGRVVAAGLVLVAVGVGAFGWQARRAP